VEKRWIWPFELLDKLGEGGMGVVYRARYVVDNRHVAVKLLPQDIANQTILSRFERELEILNTLRHPNIVRCFGGVCEGNQHFYAMELVEGGTLDKLLEERGKFSWEATIQFALQMASALAYAHERGVVHRDVKPGNFLLSPAGKLKLSDFGLATVEAATKITAAGKTMGTFPYMAPEQIRGRPPVSPQTDLYALGCVIFEMLTGRTPFVGDAPAEVMHKHLDAVPPRIADFTPDCPPALELLVRDLLQKDPNDRPESAALVIQRLTEVTPALEVTSTKSRIADIPASSAVPRGIPAVQRPATPRQAVKVGRVVDRASIKKWLAPALAALLCLSLAWNIRLLGSYAAQNRAEQLWARALLDDRPDLSEGAAKALGELAGTSPAAVAALTSALSDQRAPVRSHAIDALLAAGSAGRSALPELIRMQNSDENELVRRKATEAVRRIHDSAGGTSGDHSPLVWGLAILFALGIVIAVLMTRGPLRASRQSR